MAQDVIYKRTTEDIPYTFDFTLDLPSTDSSVTLVSIIATNTAGTDSSSTVLSGSAASGKTLTTVLQAGTEGDDYVIRATARGATSSRDFTKVVEMRVRDTIVGNV